MSRIFFDHLLNFEELQTLIGEVVASEEERHELMSLIDEIIHHRVLKCVFDHLPYDHHEEFLQMLHENPGDHLLIHFVNTRASIDLENILINKLENISKDLLASVSES